MDYCLVTPESFTAEHRRVVEEFRKSVLVVSSHTDMILGAKDVNSRHLISTDSYAHIVGLRKGVEVSDRFDREMPCEGTARFADCYVREDEELLNSGDINRKTSTLNVHQYTDGIKARIFDKFIMKHHESRSILGTVYCSRDIEISNFFALIPNYFLEFGTGCSVEKVTGKLIVGNARLTEYEQEICFLLILNWSYKQISSFLNKYRPQSTERTADTIYKCMNRICEKLGVSGRSSSHLREMLIGMGMHRKMPRSFFDRLVGSRPL